MEYNMLLIIKILYLISPLIFAGISNMIFVKSPIFNYLKKPIDSGKLLNDGKSVFGENKTWKGFIGMIVLTSLFMGLTGHLSRYNSFFQSISILPYHNFSFPFNEWFYGAVWGFSYVLFELPNSFIKRRFNIPPGENAGGSIGKMFLFIDHIDSVIGAIVFLFIFYNPSFLEIALIFLFGSLIHFCLNIMLYKLGLKMK